MIARYRRRLPEQPVRPTDLRIARSRRSNPSRFLGTFCLSQNCPGWLPQPCGDALEGRNPQIPLALFDEPVLCPMHFNVICKRLLRPVLSLSVLTDDVSNTLLQ